jgi:hypothetical protein
MVLIALQVKTLQVHKKSAPTNVGALFYSFQRQIERQNSPTLKPVSNGCIPLKHCCGLDGAASEVLLLQSGESVHG